MQEGKRQAAFTLIEIMAVTILLGIMAAIALPAFQTQTSYALRQQADQLTGTLELARQRAIMTGNAHRVRIDINSKPDIAETFVIEWIPPLAMITGESHEMENASKLTPNWGNSGAQLQLVPPTHSRLDAEYQAIPGSFGRIEFLSAKTDIEEIESPEGFHQRGNVFINFYEDGSADPTNIVLVDEAGHALTLKVNALPGPVRVVEEDL